MKKSVRLAALRLLRASGAFAVARRLTRRDLRILCYHGFSLADEHEFRPGMFVRPATLDARLTHLRDAGYAVLPLDTAVRRLADGTLPPRAVVITIDDGFYGTLSAALPLFKKHGVPATLYLTTYYVQHQQPIFNLALAYVLWRTRRDEIDFSGLGVPGVDGRVRWGALPSDDRGRIVERFVVHGNMRLGRDERAALLRAVAERAGVDHDALVASRILALVNDDEVRALRAGGVEIELHTHRHWSPGEPALAHRELADNRREIERITGRTPRHFCYPTGRSDRWRDPWLAEFDVQSATTCHAGFCDAGTPRYQLGRFLDGEDIDQLEFEAEMAGVLEFARRARARLRGAPVPYFAHDPAEQRPELAASDAAPATR